MITEPKLEDRSQQHYVAIRARLSMEEMATLMPPLFPEVSTWLGAQGVAPTGAPFIRYLIVDMERQLEIEVGFPVGTTLPGDDRVRAGVLPAGRYATMLHTGHFQGLVAATAALLAWAKENSIVWQTSVVGDDVVWGGRFEFYLTEPDDEPNPEKWETELAFLVA